MSGTTKVSCDHSRSSRYVRLVGRIGSTLAVTLLATAMLLAGRSGFVDEPVAPDQAEEISATQTAGCVEATNSTHADEGRATRFLLWVWAQGSNTYLGWIWTTTSLQEGPTGTWDMVDSCGDPGTTTTSSSSSTTSSSTTSTTAPGPDGAAIFQTNCASCHGADGSGGAGPDLRGVYDAHGAEAITEVVTNGRGGMPAWGGVLTPEEIAAVVEHVGTLEGDGGHHDDHGGGTTTTAHNDEH